MTDVLMVNEAEATQQDREDALNKELGPLLRVDQILADIINGGGIIEDDEFNAAIDDLRDVLARALEDEDVSLKGARQEERRLVPVLRLVSDRTPLTILTQEVKALHDECYGEFKYLTQRLDGFNVKIDTNKAELKGIFEKIFQTMDFFDEAAHVRTIAAEGLMQKVKLIETEAIKSTQRVEAIIVSWDQVIKQRQTILHRCLNLFTQFTKEHDKALAIAEDIEALHTSAVKRYEQALAEIDKQKGAVAVAEQQMATINEELMHKYEKIEQVYRERLLQIAMELQSRLEQIQREAKRDALRNSIIGIAVATVAAIVASAVAPYLMPSIFEATTFAASIGGAVSGTLTAGQYATLMFGGFVSGMTSSAITGSNVLESAVKGMLSAGIGAKVSQSIGNTEVIRNTIGVTKAMEAVQVAGSTAATTALSALMDGGGHLVERLLISGVTAGVGQGLVPTSAADVKILEKIADDALRTVVTTGIETILDDKQGNVGDRLLLAVTKGVVQSSAQFIGKKIGADVAQRLDRKARQQAAIKKTPKHQRIKKLFDDALTTAQRTKVAEQQAASRITGQRAQSGQAKIGVDEQRAQPGQRQAGQSDQHTPADGQQRAPKFDWGALVGLGSAHAADDRSLIPHQKKEPSAADLWVNRFGQFSEPVLFMSPEELRQQQRELHKLARQYGPKFAEIFPMMRDRRLAVDFALFLKSPAAAQRKEPSCLEYMSKLTAGIGIGVVNNTALGAVAKTFPVSSSVLSFFAIVLYLENATTKLYRSAPTLDPEFMELMHNPLLSDSVKERLWQGATMRERMFAEGTYEPFGKCISRFIREKPFETGIIIGSVEQLLRKPVGRSIAWTYHSINKRGVVVTMPANNIRFSQETVNDVLALKASMEKYGWKMFAEPIDVVRMPNGNLATIDNTRVAAAKRLGMNVKVIIRDFDAPLLDTFITGKKRFEKYDGLNTWGTAVKFRINNQSKAFRETYPNGAPDVRIGTRP